MPDEVPRYHGHLCACADSDLSRATDPVVSPGGLRVEITCAEGHRRVVPRAQWEHELARRRTAREQHHA
jgi:hypothetical protein